MLSKVSRRSAGNRQARFLQCRLKLKEIYHGKYEITEHIGVLSENAKGWTKELNMVSWNEHEPKYDIREWAPDHSRMGKGVTLTADDLAALKDLLAGIDLNSFE